MQQLGEYGGNVILTCIQRSHQVYRLMLPRQHICQADVAAKGGGGEGVYDHVFLTKTHNFRVVVVVVERGGWLGGWGERSCVFQ